MKKKHPSHKGKLDALKRIEGQVRGLQSMIEERRYCVDILTQISAVRAALGRVQKDILGTHLGSCVKNAFESKSKQNQKEKIEEILDLINKIK